MLMHIDTARRVTYAHAAIALETASHMSLMGCTGVRPLSMLRGRKPQQFTARAGVPPACAAGISAGDYAAASENAQT